jgi:caa(3)-type oxidase subunit IV
MSAHTHDHHDEHMNPDAHGSVFKRIWVPFFILFALTALEFLIAFTMPHGMARALIFLALTVVKAYYIVAFFMHLKFEKLTLALAIILPVAFVVYLIVLLMLEGGYIHNMINQ